jgi:hypothetical protein
MESFGVDWGSPGRYAAPMSEPASTAQPPAKSPEELAEIRELLEQVRRGDYSGTVPWEEVAAELGLPV